MKTTDPSFISKRERMREKQMTKKYGGEDQGSKRAFQRSHLHLLHQGWEQGVLRLPPVVRISQDFIGSPIAADSLEQFCSTLTIKQRVMD